MFKRNLRFIILLLFIVALAVPVMPTMTASAQANGCGPSGGPNVPDAPLLPWLLTWGSDNGFEDACNAHDLCYADPARDKADCDNEFYNDLVYACNTNYPSWYVTCYGWAEIYYSAVAVFGNGAYTGSYTPANQPLGVITDVWAQPIAGDEVAVYVAFGNDGTAGGLFDVRLLSQSGSVVDVEPDTYWQSVAVGESAIIEVTTNWDGGWDVFNLGETFTVQLRQYGGTVVDSATGATPLPDGDILSVSARRINEWWGDDEFEACVTFRNTGDIMGEYDMRLYSRSGRHIDTEPDTYWMDVNANGTATICVGTNGIWPSISDLGSTYTVYLREEHLGVVDSYTGGTP